MQTKLEGDHSFVHSSDPEIVFSGYNLEFTSAFYQSSNIHFAMAFSLDSDASNYLVKFEWNT